MWFSGILSSALIAVGLFWLIRRGLTQFQVQSRLRSQAERREARLKQAAAMSKLGFYIHDMVEDRTIFCTEQHAASHGVSVKEYLAGSGAHTDGPPLIHPDDRPMVEKEYQRTLDGETVEVEYRVPTADGLRWVREVATPERDAHGQVVRRFGISQDITEQRNMQNLLQSRIKMEAVGNLTGGIAHDFNNLLAVILGNLELAKGAEGKSEDLLDEAIAATLRGADLTKAMLSFARRAPLEPSVLNLNQIVQETGDWATRTLPPGIAVETRLETGLWPVKADRSSSESALLNLIVNARDAMGGEGRLLLQTSNVRVPGAQDGQDDLAPGRYVVLTASDTGTGIAPDIIGQIFDPFFTTKGPSKSSGLGLSMIQGFMEQSGGSVQVTSEPGGGTTFRLYFPAIPAELPVAASAHPNPEPRAAAEGRVVLVAEDEPAVMSVLVRSLSGAGYEVLQAPSGDAALEQFRAAARVDMVLTDIVMPGRLQGPGLVQALRREEPDLPAVYLSGYADSQRLNGHSLSNGDLRLMKPVSRDDLLAAVSQSLAG